MSPEEAIAARAQAAAPRVAAMKDLPVVAATISDAFENDPFNRWFLRQDAGYDAARMRMYLYLGSEDIPKQHVFVAGDGLAVAQWQPPGPTTLPMTLWEQLRLAPLIVRNTGLARVGRLLRLISFLEAHHPKEPHYYLFLLGVRQSAQGHGLGSALLEATLARADAAGMPAYLENSNPKNTRLYQRHGFVITKEAAPAPGAPPMQFMWREKRRP
jgi:ribosomal protein S18 acetylase RimI-like enzyme